MTDDDFVFDNGEPVPTKQEQDDDDFVFINGEPVATKEEWEGNPVPELSTLVSRGETDLIEFKEKWPGRNKDVAEEVAALANYAARQGYDDGYLVFGINDENTPVGLDNPDKTEQRLSQVCGSYLPASLRLSPRIEDDVLIVQIGSAGEELFEIDGKIPTRNGTSIEWVD